MSQWVMIGIVTAYCVASWFIAEVIGPLLGYELTTLLGLSIGVFVIYGAQKAGDWCAARFSPQRSR